MGRVGGTIYKGELYMEVIHSAMEGTMHRVRRVYYLK